MSKKAFLISSIIFLSAMILLGVLFWYEKKITSDTDHVDQSQGTEPTENTAQDPISSIKDLIDGEYQIPSVDTSKWKTYRNDELGFEVKIPQEWNESYSFGYPAANGGAIGFGEYGKMYKVEPMPEGASEENYAILVESYSHDFYSSKDVRDIIEMKKKELPRASLDKLSLQFESPGLFLSSNEQGEVLLWSDSRFFDIKFIPSVRENRRKDNMEEYDVFLGIARTFKPLR